MHSEKNDRGGGGGLKKPPPPMGLGLSNILLDPKELFRNLGAKFKGFDAL